MNINTVVNNCIFIYLMCVKDARSVSCYNFNPLQIVQYVTIHNKCVKDKKYV